MKSEIQTKSENMLQMTMAALEELFPKGIGIALFVFELNTDKGSIGYVANATREDMRACLTEFLQKWQAAAPEAPFYPLTLEAFEAYATDQCRADVIEAVRGYHKFSNESRVRNKDASIQ